MTDPLSHTLSHTLPGEFARGAAGLRRRLFAGLFSACGFGKYWLRGWIDQLPQCYAAWLL